MSPRTTGHDGPTRTGHDCPWVVQSSEFSKPRCKTCYRWFIGWSTRRLALDQSSVLDNAGCVRILMLFNIFLHPSRPCASSFISAPSTPARPTYSARALHCLLCGHSSCVQLEFVVVVVIVALPAVLPATAAAGCVLRCGLVRCGAGT
jgi:hypothetical protein